MYEKEACRINESKIRSFDLKISNIIEEFGKDDLFADKIKIIKELKIKQ